MAQHSNADARITLAQKAEKFIPRAYSFTSIVRQRKFLSFFPANKNWPSTEKTKLKYFDVFRFHGRKTRAEQCCDQHGVLASRHKEVLFISFLFISVQFSWCSFQFS